MTTAGRRRWATRSLSAMAISMAVLGAAACSDDDESPTSPAETGIAGDYQLVIQASGSCGPELDAGRIQDFDATITESGTDVTVTLASRQGLPTEGQFEGILDIATLQVVGTVDITPTESARSYQASGTITGPVGVDRMELLFDGTIQYGDAVCSAPDHKAAFVRE
ncbi:MAG: hypothetical protein ACRD2X_25820 [Vicinamibacteraceae bacterium]